MIRAQINKINIDRLSRWKERLNNEHATPMLLVGVGHDHAQGKIVLCTTEDRSDQEIYLLLKEVVRKLESNIASQN